MAQQTHVAPTLTVSIDSRKLNVFLTIVGVARIVKISGKSPFFSVFVALYPIRYTLNLSVFLCSIGCACFFYFLCCAPQMIWFVCGSEIGKGGSVLVGF